MLRDLFLHPKCITKVSYVQTYSVKYDINIYAMQKVAGL